MVGGFTEGGTVYLKTGTTHCTQCGLKGIGVFTYLGKDGNGRMALVRLPCGHEDYIPERVLKNKLRKTETGSVQDRGVSGSVRRPGAA